jgi:single-strand DNA-binding protein
MYNKFTGVGRAGRDPETRYTAGGKAVANFSIALDESYKDASGEWQKKTLWLNVTAWDKLAEIVQKNVVKGSLVLVDGRLQIREYESKGEKKTSVEIVANTVRRLEKAAAATASEATEEITDEDSIPF